MTGWPQNQNFINKYGYFIAKNEIKNFRVFSAIFQKMKIFLSHPVQFENFDQKIK